MRAWRPDPEISGPTRPSERDIEALNRVFTDAFTDRYRRDGLTGVRVPPLNPAVWRYALRLAGDGALAWSDERGGLIAFNVAHRSGSEGWMGPLAVRPDRQHGGLGKTIVRAAIDRLRAAGVTTLGLETMPRTVDNIGFYARLGFAPGHLTLTMSHDLGRRSARATPLLSARRGPATEQTVAAARTLTDTLAPGVDFTRELLLTSELGLGDTSLVEGGDGLAAYALWHTASLADTATRDELRVLKLVARDHRAFDAAISAIESAAGPLDIWRVTIRCQSAYTWAFRRLVERGYRVRWTDLRMALEDRPERQPADGLVFSNWEI